jgi:hypothetical protein
LPFAVADYQFETCRGQACSRERGKPITFEFAEKCPAMTSGRDYSFEPATASSA